MSYCKHNTRYEYITGCGNVTQIFELCVLTSGCTVQSVEEGKMLIDFV